MRADDVVLVQSNDSKSESLPGGEAARKVRYGGYEKGYEILQHLAEVRRRRSNSSEFGRMIVVI